MKNKTTSWGMVADWYDDLLTSADTYQVTVILPNLLRLLGPIQNKAVLDLGCGQGFFTRALTQAGAMVTGVDISSELIALAKKNVPKGKFLVCSAEKLIPLPAHSFEIIIAILTLQNIQNIPSVFKECARVLNPGGRLLIVMNHPAFRIPKNSSWGWDETKSIQYRRIEKYLAEITVPIDMHPGQIKKATTLSFHRPLQYYFKLLGNSGLAVTRLEEWISPKTTSHGPRAAAENIARKEFPLFLFLEAKIST